MYASVTWLARDPGNSNVADLAAEIPFNHGLAEEIIPLNPDLVIAGIYTARPAVAMLKRTGTPLAEVGVPKNLAEVRQQIRDILFRQQYETRLEVWLKEIKQRAIIEVRL